MELNPYLSFDGRCDEALEFYAKCLGATVKFKMTYAGSPMEGSVSSDWQNKVLHATFSVGERDFGASDSPPDRYQLPKGIAISINLKDVSDAERIYTEMSEGGSVDLPIQETFWASRFAMFRDRFGIPWMINCEKAM